MRTKIHWLSIILAYSTLFLLGLSDNIRGPLFPEVLKDLSLSDSKGSGLWAASSMMAFVCSFLSRWVLVRLGSLGTLKISVFLMASGQLGMAYSFDYVSAIISCASLGACFGFLGVVQNLLVLQAGPPSTIQRLQAGLHSNFALASFAAPLFLSLVNLFSPGWRMGYLMGGLVSLAGFIALMFVSNEEFRHENFRASKPDRFREDNPKRLHAIYMGSILALYVVVEIMVSSRLALFLRREAGLDFDGSNWATTLFFVGLLAGRVLFIFWKPEKSLKIQLILSLLLTLLFLILGLTLYPFALIVTGLTMAPFFPLAMSYLREKFPSHLEMITAAAITLNGLYVVMMHFGVGYFSDSFGLRAALWIGPIATVIAIFLLYFDTLFDKKKHA
jgi:FHS family glucose/mannose:H+ symporter-like MFS transporter